MGEEDERRAALESALRLLAQGQGLQRPDAELVRLLAGKLRVLAEAWDIDVRKGAAAARTTIYAQLVAHLHQLTPPVRRPQGNTYPTLVGEKRFKQFEHVILVLFNAASWYTSAFEGPNQQDRYEWLDSDGNHKRYEPLVSYRIRPGTARRDMDYAITSIAAVLAARRASDGGSTAEQPADDTRLEIAPKKSGRLDPTYVPRPVLEGQVRSALLTSRLVVLVGEGGTGKSTLAQAVSSTMPHFALRADDENVLLATARRALGVDAEHLSDAAALLRFERFLADERSASFLTVLDNVDDWHLVEHVLPPEPAGKVLITARREVAGRPCTYVRVGSLTDTEAEQMVRRRLPDAQDSDVKLLACLRGRPLAVAHACAFLAQRDPDQRSAFLAAIQKHVVRALDFAAGSLGQQGLKSIYHEIIQGLAAHSETSAAVDFLQLAAAANNPVWIETAAECLWHSHDDPDLGLLAAQSAIAVLERYQLIDPDADAVVHPLTLDILRELFAASLVERAKQVAEYLMLRCDEEVAEAEARRPPDGLTLGDVLPPETFTDEPSYDPASGDDPLDHVDSKSLPVIPEAEEEYIRSQHWYELERVLLGVRHIPAVKQDPVLRRAWERGRPFMFAPESYESWLDELDLWTRTSAWQREDIW